MRTLDDLAVNGVLSVTGSIVAGQNTASISKWALGSAAWLGSVGLNTNNLATWAGIMIDASGQVTVQSVGANTVKLAYANTSLLTAGSTGVSLPQLTTNGLVKTTGGTGLLSIADAGTDYLAVSSITGVAGQIARFSGTNTIVSDAGFRTSQASGITWRVLLDGSASATTNTELVLVGRNATGGQTDLSWYTGVGGSAIRRMTARWNDSADQLEIFSSDDAGASRANRILIPRTTASAMVINGLTSITGRLDVSNGGIYVTQGAQEALTLIRTSSTVSITHGMDFSALNGASATVVYSKIRNYISTSVAGSESSALYFYTKNNSVENKNFAIYKDYVSIGSVPFYQNDGGRVLIDATGKGIFTALTSAGTITFSALTAGFVKSSSAGVLSVDASTYIPYQSSLPVANFGFIAGSPPTWLSATGYMSSQGHLMSDTRGLNWRGGLLSNDYYWGLGQDASDGSSFKPFIIGAGTRNIWLKIDPLASVKTTITGGLTLSGFGTGTIISTAGVLSNLTGTNIVLADGTTIAQSTFAQASSISGTINKIPKFLTSSTLTNSSITDSGTLVSIANPLTATGNITAPNFVGNLTGYKNVDSSNEITLANGFVGGVLHMNYRGTSAAITELRFNNGLSTGAYIPLRASSYIVNGGTSSQFLKADGSLDSTTYLSSASYIGGLSYYQSSGWAGVGPAWVKVATANISSQFGSCVGKIRFTFQGGNGGTTAVSGHSGTACFRMKQQSAMSSSLDLCSLWWETSTNMQVSDFIAVKTTDTAVLKSVDFYIRCNETYDGLAYVWEVLLGSTVPNTYTTVAPSATYTAVGNINLDLGSSKTNILNNLSVSGTTSTINALLGTNVSTIDTTVTLNVNSPYYQHYNGAYGPTITMPVVSTLTLGQSWLIKNATISNIICNSSGGNLIATIQPNTFATITCISLSGTTASSWTVNYPVPISGASLTGPISVPYATNGGVNNGLTIANGSDFNTAIANAGLGIAIPTGGTSSPFIIQKAGSDLFKIDTYGNVTTLGNISATNILAGYTTTISSLSSIFLTSTSTFHQYITGTTSQIIIMPDVTTLKLGQTWHIKNATTQTVLITPTSGGSVMLYMITNTEAYITCISLTGNVASSWSIKYDGFEIASNNKLTVQGSIILNGAGSNPTMTFPSTSQYVAPNPCTTIGDIPYAASTNTPSTMGRLAASATVGSVLVSTGASSVPEWTSSPILNNYLPLAGGTMSSATAMINFPDTGTSTTNTHGLSGIVGVNDWWRIIAGNTNAGGDAGYLEIATGNDGDEPIYVRQYKTTSPTSTRTLTLLNSAGHTSLPGELTTGGRVLAVNARFGTANSAFLGEYAYFGHNTQYGAGSVGFIHSSVGEVLINGASSKSIQLSISAITKFGVETSRVYTSQKLEVANGGIPTGSGSFGLRVGLNSDMGATNSAALFVAVPSSYSSWAFQIDKARTGVFGIDADGSIVKSNNIIATGYVQSGYMILSSMIQSSVNYGTLSNLTQWNAGSYAIAHGDLGDLWLNAASGRSVNVTVNNTTSILSVQSTKIISSKIIESSVSSGAAFKSGNSYVETTTGHFGVQRISSTTPLADLSAFWVFPSLGYTGDLYLPEYPSDGCAFGIAPRYANTSAAYFWHIRCTNADHKIVWDYNSSSSSFDTLGYCRLHFIVYDYISATWYLNY